MTVFGFGLERARKAYEFFDLQRTVGEATIKEFLGDMQTEENLLREFTVKNLIVNAGKDLAASLLGGRAGAAYLPLAYCALGTGTTAAAATDTALQTEVYRKSVSSISYQSTGKVIFDTTFSTLEANNYTITELGWLNASSAGTLWNHIILSGGNTISKTNDRSLSVSYTPTFS